MAIDFDMVIERRWTGSLGVGVFQASSGVKRGGS